MPAGDGTGPMGLGPMTGRGMGNWAGYHAPGWSNWGPGRGFYGRGGYVQGGGGIRGGRRGGGGWGWRRQFYATGLPRWGPAPAAAYGASITSLSREQEIEMLRDESEWLKEQLDAITQRMEELSQE